MKLPLIFSLRYDIRVLGIIGRVGIVFQGQGSLGSRPGISWRTSSA